MTAKADKAHDNLVDIMARDIQAGVLTPGTWLKQIDLEKRYRATRMDVRRALDQLTLKRLVRHVPNRGYHVHALDPRQEDEIRTVRVILEVAAVDAIIENATTADVAELRGLAQRFADLILTGTILEQYEANVAFHVRLLKLCSNRELVGMVHEMRSRGPSAPLSQWKTRARIEQSGREHFLIVDALEARDAPELRRLITAHIRQTKAEDSASSQPALRKSG